MDSNLISGFIGAILGAFSSFGVAWYANRKQVEALTFQRRLNSLTEGLQLSGKLLENFRSYKPNLITSSKLGLKIDKDFEFSIREAIQDLQKFKRFTFLLPIELRNRWLESHDLVVKLSHSAFTDIEERKIAELETYNYLAHLHNSILEVLEGRDLPPEVPIPNFDGSILKYDGDVEDLL